MQRSEVIEKNTKLGHGEKEVWEQTKK
jgi:hypothetical protein